ncbi:hypothetical protein C1752_09717 [Acaryochloris thomasi RCC1774]|uniref:Uncharacterized protein n=1 Tax=Acaryochloris thomasi RCC1774 TaxID=1764569 RepID=A0A2W1JNA9_9CYAN|nr:hypothetical protein [Acaryochloris thomasi]PZD70741.1 hypothetical protein C1752_09717 [Acaryochloris thomasi RCC1774]
MKIRSTWIPYPGAWLSAVLLLLLTGAIAYGGQVFLQMGYPLIQFSPNVGILFGLLALLMPIFVVAIAHHTLHLFLDHFFPDSQTSAQKKVQGFFPNLMSWWEGLYGWQVIVLSTLITAGLISGFTTPDVSYANLYSLLSAWDKTRYIFTFPTLIWIVISAYLYQFEHLVHRHLMSLNSGRR